MSESQSPGNEITHGQTATQFGGQMREAHVAVADADFEPVGIGDLVSLWREAGLRHVEPLACRKDGAIVQVTVTRRLDTDQLGTLEYVDRWEQVSSADNARQYVLEFTAPKFPLCIVNRMDGLVDVCTPKVTENGFLMPVVGPQRAIAELVEEYRAAGMSPQLRKLGSYDGRERPLDTLTDQQRDVLKTAYEMGYYEVPRNVSSAQLANELDLEASTVTEHLQRAERNLLTQHFSRAEPSFSRC